MLAGRLYIAAKHTRTAHRPHFSKVQEQPKHLLKEKKLDGSGDVSLSGLG